MNEKVYLDKDLHLYDLADLETRQEGFMNVPVKNIIALSHKNFWEKGQNWRDVTHELHGKDWTDEVFNYFESELLEKLTYTFRRKK